MQLARAGMKCKYGRLLLLLLVLLAALSDARVPTSRSSHKALEPSKFKKLRGSRHSNAGRGAAAVEPVSGLVDNAPVEPSGDEFAGECLTCLDPEECSEYDGCGVIPFCRAAFPEYKDAARTDYLMCLAATRAEADAECDPEEWRQCLEDSFQRCEQSCGGHEDPEVFQTAMDQEISKEQERFQRIHSKAGQPPPVAPVVIDAPQDGNPLVPVPALPPPANRQLNGVNLPIYNQMLVTHCTRAFGSRGIQGFQCGPYANTHAAEIGALLNSMWNDRLVVHSPSRKVDELCRASRLSKPKFRMDILEAPANYYAAPPAGQGGTRFMCIRTNFKAGTEAFERCADAMQQRVCHCYTHGPHGWTQFTAAQYQAADLSRDDDWRCGQRLPSDAELLTQEIQCLSPVRREPDATVYARAGLGGCPLLPRKYHPMAVVNPAPAPVLNPRNQFGRPRFLYTRAEVAVSAAARSAIENAAFVMYTDTTANPPLLRLAQVHGVFAGPPYTIALVQLFQSAGQVYDDDTFADWRPVAVAPAAPVALADMEQIYVNVAITCQGLRRRFGRVQLGDCTPLYHGTNDQNNNPAFVPGFWENTAAFTPRQTGGANFFAFDWFYSANFCAWNGCTRLIEYVYRGNKPMLNLGWFASYAAFAASRTGSGSFAMMVKPSREGNPRTELQELIMAGKVKDLKKAYRAMVNNLHAGHQRIYEWYDMQSIRDCEAAGAADQFFGYVGTDYGQGREVSFFRNANNDNGGVADLRVSTSFWLGRNDQCQGRTIDYTVNHAPLHPRNAAAVPPGGGVPHQCQTPAHYPANPNWIRRKLPGGVSNLNPGQTVSFGANPVC